MPEELTYRQCAAALVLRPLELCTSGGSQTEFEVLIVHKPRKNDDWQIPQGGIEEGESMPEAAIRELKEETGLDIEILEPTDLYYQYDYPAHYRQRRPDQYKGQRVHFVIAKPKPGSKVTVDRNEIDGHAWILPELLPQYIEREPYLKVLYRLVESSRKYL